MVKTLSSFNHFDNIIFYGTPNRVYDALLNVSTLLTNIGLEVHKTLGDIVAEFMFTNENSRPVMIFAIAPWNYVNSSESIPNLGKILTNRNLAVILINDIFNRELKEFVSTSLGASMETKLIFLLIGHELTEVLPFIRQEKLLRFFRWCWSKNILNAILMYQEKHVVANVDDLKMEIYSYSPFPRPIKLIKLTNVHPFFFFFDRTLDVRGYEFKTPVFNDKPSVFKAKRLDDDDDDDNDEEVSGIAGHLYLEFVKSINGKFVELETPESHPMMLDYEYELLVARNIDIAIHPFSNLLPHGYYGSYPITNTNSCVLVPVIPEIFVGHYIPRIMNLNMWLQVLVLFTGFQVAYFLIDKFNGGKWYPWKSISLTLKGMLNMSLGEINVSETFGIFSRSRILLIHMLVLLSGMLYSLSFIAGLTSALSATIFGKKLETLEDLRRANISIMMLDYMYFMYNYMDIIPNSFESNVLIADVETVSHHLNSLNTSFAYAVYNEEWQVLQSLQKKLWKPKFRIASKLCIANVYLSFPIQFNSAFYHPLKNFILRIRETGLELKWTSDILKDIRETTSGVNLMNHQEEHPVPLTIDHLRVIWTALQQHSSSDIHNHLN
uniref:Ionotropic glutamate receptor C-terminal domain-containing protein n=1 Tax=Musca domestica TaxID=7370 RepID=A0A1I8N6R2_MUSDO